MHQLGIVTGDEAHVIAVAGEQREQLFVAHSGEERWAGKLVSVEMQDGEHGAVAGRIQEFAGVPGGGQRSRFRFAIAHDASDEEIGIVERGAVGMHEAVAELAAFVHGAGRERGKVAGQAAGPGEIADQVREAREVLAVALEVFGESAFEVQVGEDGGRSVAGSYDQQDARSGVLYQTVEVGVNQVESGLRAPVAEQARFDMGRLKRLAQKSVLPKIELRGAEIVRRTEMRLDLGQTFLGWGHGCSYLSSMNAPRLHGRVSCAPPLYLLGNRCQESPPRKIPSLQLSVVL